jgi:DNA-binding response OmpR family regulator
MSSTTPSTEPSARSDRQIVCVIDDDARLREAICSVLEHAGFAPVQASDGNIGFDVVAKVKPVVVVTDIIMPNREGIETIQALKQHFPKIPILAMSGSYSPGKNYLEWADAIGADDCLAKPFHPAALIEKVKRLAATAG